MPTSARVALTGRTEAYFTDYRGAPQEFVSLAKRGFLYQGQRYRWQDQPRGTPTTGLGAASFVAFLQNHDQLANSGLGHRLHGVAAPGRWRALTALLLLGPATPMLFQGQEFGASAPFLYFADHQGEAADAVAAGRKAEVSQFPSLATAAMQAVDHIGGDATRFQHQTRQRRGERSAFAVGASDCDDLGAVMRRGCCHQPIRVFSCRMTSEMVLPSARAEKVSAMRCLRTGSARSSTSSMDGASRPSSRARARTASISA